MFFFIPFPTQLKIKIIFLKTKSNTISCAFVILNPLIIKTLLTTVWVCTRQLSEEAQQSLWAHHMQSPDPKDAGTQGGTLGPLHFAGNGSRKKTALVMALLVLIPARGGEDWRSSGTRTQLSWLPSDLGTNVNQEHNCRAKNHPKSPAKIQPPPSNLVQQKSCNVTDLSQLPLWT